MLRTKGHQISLLVRRVLSVMAAALLLASCGNKVNTDQLAFRTYGINCMNEGRYEEAVQAFQGALDCANGNITDVEIDICLYKAKALFFAERNEDALEVYNAILDYDNDIPEAYYQRGCLFLVTGNHDWAIKDYESAIEHDKHNYELYIGIYTALKSYKYDEEARSYLQQGIDAAGNKTNDNLYKGRMYLLLGDYANAKKYLELATSQDCTDAQLYLADVYRALGDNGAAMDALKIYMSSDDISPDAVITAGEIELESGNYADAISFFESVRGVEGEYDESKLLHDLAVAYEFSGDFASAKDVLSQYLEMNPDDEAAQREMIFLENR